MRNPLGYKLAKTDKAGKRRGGGLFLYPEISDAIEPLLGAERDAIRTIIASPDNRDRWRRYVHDAIGTMLLYKTKPDRICEAWYLIEANIEDLAGEANDWSDADLIPAPRRMERFMRHHDQIIYDLIDDITKTPPEVGPIDPKFNNIVAFFLRAIADLELKCRVRPSYREIYNLLIDQSGRSVWLENKYSRKSADRQLRVLIRNPYASTPTLHLVALDESSLQRVENGEFDDLPLENFSAIGDLIYGMYYYQVIELRENEHRAARSLLSDLLTSGELWYKWQSSLTRYGKYLQIKQSQIGAVIDRRDIFNAQGNTSQIIEMLDRYAKEFPGQPIGEIAFAAFQKLQLQGQELSKTETSHKASVGSKADMPAAAPVAWSFSTRLLLEAGTESEHRETPPEFIRRVYGDWLGRGLTRANLRNLDHNLSKALDRYLTSHPMPKDIDLPTLKEKNTREASRWKDAVNSDGTEATFTRREAQRLAVTAHRREKEKRGRV